MGKKIEMVGRTFGRLTVLYEIKERNDKGAIIYMCKCYCGKSKAIKGLDLRCGKSKTCCRTNKSTHGLANSVEYHTWCNIKIRCKSHKDYIGIKVCDRWKNSFENFISDMGFRPKDKMSIDRIDVNGDYSPENCRWSDALQQGRNKRNNNVITYNGETKCLSEWLVTMNMPNSTYYNRIYSGWSFDKIFNTPISPSINVRNSNKKIH